MKIHSVRSIDGGRKTPGQVQGLAATVVSSTEIDITWASIPGSQNYTVRLNGNPIVHQLATSFQILGLAPSTTYSITVAAINAYGEGLQSPPVMATTMASLQPPAQVTGLSATAINQNEIDLAWSISALASTYAIQRNGATVANIATTSFQDLGLTPGTTYTYDVIASNTAGNAAPSAFVSAATPTAVQPGTRTYKYVPSVLTDIGLGNGSYAQFTALVDSVRGTAVKAVQWYPKTYQYDRGTTGPNYVGQAPTSKTDTAAWGHPYVKACLDYAWNGGTNPVFVAWLWTQQTYGGGGSSIPSNTYPPWMVSQGYAININPSKTNTNSCYALWVSGALTAMQALDADFASNYDSHPALIMYAPCGETGIDTSIPPTPAAYIAYVNNQISELLAARANFLQTPLRWIVNNTESLSHTFQCMDQLANDTRGGYFVGGPDPGCYPGPNPANRSVIVQAWNAYLGLSASGAQTSHASYLGGPLGFYAEMQDNQQQYNLSSTTPGNLNQSAHTMLAATYFAFQNNTGVAGYSNANLITMAAGSQGVMNATAPNDGNTWVTPTLGVSGPGTPQNVRYLLMGQTSVQSTGSPPNPPATNSLKLGWDPVTGATSYNLYRGTVFGGESLYFSGIAGTSYSDNNANGCVSGTAGSSPPYYAANTYYYKVTAVNASAESARSANPYIVLYQNGTLVNGLPEGIGGDFSNGVTINYLDTSGSPQGGVGDLALTWTNPSGFYLPFSGNQMTEWNIWAGAVSSLQFYIKAKTGSQFQMAALRVGDVPIYNPSGTQRYINVSSYCTVQTGTWVLCTIPLVDLFGDYGPSGAGPQITEKALYKWLIQPTSGVAVNDVTYLDYIRYV